MSVRTRHYRILAKMATDFAGLMHDVDTSACRPEVKVWRGSLSYIGSSAGFDLSKKQWGVVPSPCLLYTSDAADE